MGHIIHCTAGAGILDDDFGALLNEQGIIAGCIGNGIAVKIDRERSIGITVACCHCIDHDRFIDIREQGDRVTCISGINRRLKSRITRTVNLCSAVEIVLIHLIEDEAYLS